VPEKTLGERAIILVIGRAAAVVIGIATPMVLVRVFSQTDFGAYRQINLAILTVIGILTFGFPQSLYYFFPKYPTRRKTFISQALFSQVIFGCIFLGITLFSGKALAEFFKHDIFLTASPLIGCIVLFQLMRTMMETLLIVENRVTWASMYIVSRDVIRGLSLVIVVLIVPTLMAIVYTLLIYEGICFLLIVAYVAKRYHIYRFPFSRSNFVEQAKYSFPLGWAATAASLTQRLDQFFIIGRFSPAAYAIYSQGSYPMRFFYIPHQSIFDLVIPNVVGLVRDGKQQELLRLWHNLISKLAIITVPVVVLSQIVGVDAMVLLFTEEYRASGVLFRIYVLVLLRYITAFSVLPRAFARTGLIFQANIVALIVMAVTGWIGTIYFGMFGTVAAMLLSQYVHAYIQLQGGRREIGLPWRQFFPWKNLLRVVGVSVLSAVLPAISSYLIHSIIGRLLIAIPLYAASYVWLLYAFRIYDWFHDPTIRRILNRYLPFLLRSHQHD
jgi:O-antigen/teichoic acid export membrane protein